MITKKRERGRKSKGGRGKERKGGRKRGKKEGPEVAVNVLAQRCVRAGSVLRLRR